MLYGGLVCDPTAEVQWDAPDLSRPPVGNADPPPAGQIRAADGLDHRELIFSNESAPSELGEGEMPPFMQLLTGAAAAESAASPDVGAASAELQEPGAAASSDSFAHGPGQGDDSTAAASMQQDQTPREQDQAEGQRGQHDAVQPVTSPTSPAEDVAMLSAELPSSPVAGLGERVLQQQQQQQQRGDVAMRESELRTVTQTRQGFKQEHRVRQLKSLYLRGSCVVLINPVQEGAQHRLSYRQPHRRLT